MAKPDNIMSEDDLLSALGITSNTAEPESKPTPELDADVLVDVFVTGNAPSSKKASGASTRRASRSSSNSSEREAQLKEKSLRSREWKRELERQQMRTQAFSQPKPSPFEDEDTSKSQDVIRVKAQPIIPNSSDMDGIEDAASRAWSQRKAADDEVEKRRQAMQAQMREKQAQVAQQAEAARQAAEMRQQAQMAAQQAQAAQQAKQQRHQQPISQPPVQAVPRKQSQPVATQSQPRNSQPFATEAQPEPMPMMQAGMDASSQRPIAPAQTLAKPKLGKKRGGGVKPVPVGDVPPSKESPIGVVLIVLAVLCVLVAASLLTGLWDISNL